MRAVLLDHSYTEANLSLRNLKGNDQARAHALLAAAEEAGFTAHLALVTFHKSGELEDDDYDYHRHSRYDDDDEKEASASGTMGEIYEEDLTISDWRDKRDRKVDLGNYLIDKNVLISKEKFGEGEPDQEESEGYTGNAGCTMDYWYRSAAIVLWAVDDHERILCEYDLRRAGVMLGKLSAAKKTGPGSPFHRLATAAIARYPEALPYLGARVERHDFSADPLHLLVTALAKTGSCDLLERLLKNLPASACVCLSHLRYPVMVSSSPSIWHRTLRRRLQYPAQGRPGSPSPHAVSNPSSPQYAQGCRRAGANHRCAPRHPLSQTTPRPIVE